MPSNCPAAGQGQSACTSWRAGWRASPADAHIRRPSSALLHIRIGRVSVGAFCTASPPRAQWTCQMRKISRREAENPGLSGWSESLVGSSKFILGEPRGPDDIYPLQKEKPTTPMRNMRVSATCGQSQRLYATKQADLAEFGEHTGALHESRSSRSDVFPCPATPISGPCQAPRYPLPRSLDGPACATNPSLVGQVAMPRWR